ncbi:YfcE family phosphodiesterase [Halovenus sp. WSH3]|uniref:Phosphoesterase n=1 Tax=Halovenus carboxidivorans TaxID=2692199 RepID=A0A6B0T8V1_9EURY|nr:metallophosphoesterase family protein [Halovenus carboxidivorans]MXR52003.1 YfcE family phosphodiesterase [Halovenus carboxidivorans]
MEIAIVSDTHIPSREQTIPEQFRERIADADHVIHAGDFDSKGALAEIQDLAPALTAVAGNMDPQIGLPEVATVELGGVEFVVTHGTGSPRGYERRVANAVRKHADSEQAVGVAGHTHELLDTTHDGIRLLNPGSLTGARPASEATMLAAAAEDGSLSVTVREA